MRCDIEEINQKPKNRITAFNQHLERMTGNKTVRIVRDGLQIE